MVLERDNTNSVTTTVFQGRAAYGNLKRSLRYFISTHFSEMLLTAAASTIPAGEALSAFRPTQVNLLTGITPGLALLMVPTRSAIEVNRPGIVKSRYFRIGIFQCCYLNRPY